MIREKAIYFQVQGKEEEEENAIIKTTLLVLSSFSMEAVSTSVYIIL